MTGRVLASVSFTAFWRWCWKNNTFLDRDSTSPEWAHKGDEHLGALVTEMMHSLTVWHLFMLSIDTEKRHGLDICQEHLGEFLFSRTVSVSCLSPPRFHLFLKENCGKARPFTLRLDLVLLWMWRSLLFLMCCSFSPPLRCPTGLPMPGGDWRTQWGSRTWAGRSGSNSTTNTFRVTQRGWVSAVTTAALKVWRFFQSEKQD